MIKTLNNFLVDYKISNCTVIIGFSGGIDSCALALGLIKLKEIFNLRIVLAYFNHNWRKEALNEEEFTKNFATKHGLEFFIQKAPINSAKTEEVARELRYLFFQNAARNFNSRHVFLAHNLNDNVETLIYRLIKGTSINGLTSIPSVRDIYYRPLLNIQREQIEEFIKANNQNFMFDSSNNDIKYKRNLIRKEILPLFEKINPKYLNSINNLILNSIQSKNIIQEKIEEIKKEIYIDDKIDYSKYTDLKIELRLEILNDFIGKYLKYRDRKNLLKYDNFILENKHSKTSLNKNYFLRTRFKKIFIEKGKDEQ